MEKRVILSHEGFETLQEALSADHYKIYRSNTRISTLKFYVGKAEKLISKSTTIPSKFHDEISMFKGIISIGRTQVKGYNPPKYDFKNIHLYSPMCETLDGYERICYMYGFGENMIKIRECARSRGDNYSAYYKELSKKLINAGFVEKDKEFTLNSENIHEFIKIVNQICDNAERRIYRQEFTDEIQFVKGSYFNTFYWIAEPETEKLAPKESNEGETINFVEIERQLFNLINNSSDPNLLYKVGKKLKELSQFAEIKSNLQKSN